jgi:predicted negative regulator of RcsB-dependent stress response
MHMMTQNIRKKSMIDRILDFFVQNNQTLTLVLGIFIAMSCLYFGHMWWVHHNNKAAQQYFGRLVIEYNRALQEETYDDWDGLRTKFENGFDKHARATLLPYYQNYVVTILLRQEKNEEALALLDTIVTSTKGSSLHNLYLTERALLDIDHTDSERQKIGEQALQTLASNATNQFQDTAQFYLGRYYWSNDRLDEARAVWQQLLDAYADEKIAPSPWIQQVKEYLKVTIV